MKGDGIESSGQRLVSTIGKTKIIAFLSILFSSFKIVRFFLGGKRFFSSSFLWIFLLDFLNLDFKNKIRYFLMFFFSSFFLIANISGFSFGFFWIFSKILSLLLKVSMFTT